MLSKSELNILPAIIRFIENLLQVNAIILAQVSCTVPDRYLFLNIAGEGHQSGRYCYSNVSGERHPPCR